MTTTPEDRLVDSRLGVLTDVHRVAPDPRMPSNWVAYGAHVGRVDRWGPWRADAFGFGAALGVEAAARGAAIGEAVERYCGNAIPPGLHRTAYAELDGDALDPTTLALYSDRQYGLPGFPFVRFGRDLPVSWTRGTDLATGTDVWVPASLVYLDWFHGSRQSEPATHSLMYSGIATAPDRATAERTALEELVERDACTIWWASGAAIREIDDQRLVVGQLGRVGPDLRVRLLHVPSEFGIPVVAAFLEEDGRVAFGSACRSDPRVAATKALVEALGLLQLTRQLDDPAGEVWRSVGVGEIERHVFLPHRPDRRYLDGLSEDYRELTDLPPVAQLYLDPRMSGAPLDRLRPTETVPLSGIPRGDRYVERLAARGIRVVSVDLTTPDVAAAGLHVVRVVAAGLVGNAPPAFPLRGGRRLYELPARLGWADRTLTEDDLVPHPIPLA